MNNNDLKLVKAWHQWSDIWLASSLLLMLIAGVGGLFSLSCYFNAERHAWFEANGAWIIAAVHTLYIPLLWQVYCGHRMSKAKDAVDQCAAQTARELEA